MFNLATEPGFNKFLQPSPPPLKFHSLCLVMLSRRCTLADNWQGGGRGWKIFPIAGHDLSRVGLGWGGGLVGHSSGITSTIAKWKPFLERGGQQRALCLGSAFWPRRNTISCHAPPPPPHTHAHTHTYHLASWADHDSRVGWAECRAGATSPSFTDNCCP